MADLRSACPAMKIDEAPPVAHPTGSEILPCASGGAAASLTARQIAGLAPAPDLASLLGRAAPADSALDTDLFPALRSGALLLVPLSALADALADDPAPAGALADADLLRLSQGGAAALATLGSLKAHVLAGLAPHLAAQGAQPRPAPSDQLLLLRPYGTSLLVQRVLLSDLAALLAQGSAAAESAPGVLLRSVVETVQATSGTVELSTPIPAGSRLLSMRLRVDDAISATGDGAPQSLDPVLLCGSASLPFPVAAGSSSAVLPALFLDAETWPAVRFAADDTSQSLDWTGAVRIGLAWEEPSPLPPLATES